MMQLFVVLVGNTDCWDDGVETVVGPFEHKSDADAWSASNVDKSKNGSEVFPITDRYKYWLEEGD
jgi:hypothetical protein